uniref:OO_Ba0005L10-OO_Ba0081K17.9 protein n=1 Tax=Oryza officinalis TaxID=4535 RepID=D0ABD5_9ORYZ|nr:OO_Ba0005L10-OO_Ba0081K17.9 [Oryza officinalis]
MGVRSPACEATNYEVDLAGEALIPVLAVNYEGRLVGKFCEWLPGLVHGFKGIEKFDAMVPAIFPLNRLV